METEKSILSSVKEYYGKVLSTQDDLKTDACCTSDSLPLYQRRILSRVNGEVLEKFYGCGSPIPLALEGCTILDLGCGSGRDVYLAAGLVGESGKVIGLDMTDEQLAVARKHEPSQALTFGFQKPNTEFIRGRIENLSAAGIEDNSVDIVISNCVVNLSPDKNAVFREVLRVLKPGGEFYFSDIYSDRRIPENLRKDPVLYSECLSGALYEEDFRRMFQKLGIADIRKVSDRPVPVKDAELEVKVSHIEFRSITYRIFNLPQLEDICEDFGQVARYLGTIPHAPYSFELDDHHLFEKGKAYAVCSNTASMLSKTRFASHFEIIGDTSVHYGRFDCVPAKTENGEYCAC